MRQAFPIKAYLVNRPRTKLGNVSCGEARRVRFSEIKFICTRLS